MDILTMILQTRDPGKLRRRFEIAGRCG